MYYLICKKWAERKSLHATKVVFFDCHIPFLSLSLSLSLSHRGLMFLCVAMGMQRRETRQRANSQETKKERSFVVISVMTSLHYFLIRNNLQKINTYFLIRISPSRALRICVNFSYCYAVVVMGYNTQKYSQCF